MTPKHAQQAQFHTKIRAGLNMLGWLRTRAALRDTANQLYGASVTQARHETFYAAWDVPDTLTGRFEMIVLHLFLVVERLQKDGTAGQELARAMLEAFVIDIDDHMREVGIADLKVPKHVKKAAAIAYDRFGDYGAALASPNDDTLCRLLLVQVYSHDWSAAQPSSQRVTGAAALAKYMRACRSGLAAQTSEGVKAAALAFPDPEAGATDRSA